MFDRRGFALLELLVSVMILAACLVPVSACIVTIRENLQAAEREQVALQLAQGKLEEMIGQEYGTIEGTSQSEPFPPPHTGFSYSIRVTEDTDFSSGLKYITVTVFYTTPGGEVEKCAEICGAVASK